MKTTLLIQKSLGIIALIAIFSTQSTAQTTADFEGFGLETDTFINNAMGAGFASGNIKLANNFNEDWGSWDAWAISTTTDVETPGYGNQYSSITGGGADGSTTYAVSFQFTNTGLSLTGAASGGAVEGMYVTNNTYAYLSMRDGDGFAKRFGGETGDDPDYFLLTIKGQLSGVESEDSIEFYLADYRFDDNTMDYIVNEWTYVDLQPLGNVDSLTFTLSSTDNGDFGMNTPAYFCMDNFTTTDMVVAVDDIAIDQLAVFPNPTSDKIHFSWKGNSDGIAKLYNTQGQLVAQQFIQEGNNVMNINYLAIGMYSLVCEGEDLLTVNRVVVK